jgi:hypothetical protein
MGGMLSMIVILMPALARAEEATAYRRGNAFMFFFVIGAVLIYGIHDAFHERWITLTSAVVIPLSLYLMLPSK